MVEEGKVFILMTSGPGRPERCATPFYMAELAAVMENQASIAFQVEGVLLMKRGIADDIQAIEGGKPIIEFIREAHEAGVEFYCCSSAMQAQGMTKDDLIDECNGAVGGAWILDAASEADVVLSY